MYKCYNCTKQFTGGSRISNLDIWKDYTEGKQTYTQLSEKYDCSIRTIQRRLDVLIAFENKTFPSIVNLLIDTTYFGRVFGVMVFKDSITKKVLLTKIVKYETNKAYLEGIAEIVQRGIAVQSIVCDGRQGLKELFGTIPVQLCQFHQIQTVTKYLTKNPKMQASIELKEIVAKLVKSSKNEFIKSLDEWEKKWRSFIDERSEKTELKKSAFKHKKLRSAFLSLKRNLGNLFVYQDFKELMINNTTNGIDGLFADMKNKLRNHNGLTQERKIKFILNYLATR